MSSGDPLSRRTFGAAVAATVAGSWTACAPGGAGGPATATPSRPRGFSSTGLARLAEVMRGHVERGEVAGVVTVLGRGDHVHVETFGAQDLAAGTPMQRDTLFRIVSMTKPVTAAAAMILVEEGALALDEPVDRLLPELADRRVLRRLDGELDDTVPAHRAITLRDLLTFRLGLGAVMAPPGTYPIQRAMEEARIAPGFDPIPHPPDELMRRLSRLPLVHQPGEAWLYHTGSEIAGVLIARAAGMPFQDFLAERIFVPLGMKDTAFSAPAAKLDRLGPCYQVDAATRTLTVWDEPRTGLWSRPPVFHGGGGQGGGLLTTADDYLAFCRMLRASGEHAGGRILARTSVEAMTTDQLTPAQKAASPFVPGFWDHHGWGFGLHVGTRPRTYGWTGGAGTTFFVDPREDLIGILLIQRLMTSPEADTIATDFGTLAYQALDA